MKFVEELELANFKLEEAKQLHQQVIKKAISLLFEEIKDIVDFGEPFWRHMLHYHGIIFAIRIVRKHTDMGLKEAKELVFDNQDVLIKLSNNYYNKLLSKEE